MERKVIVMSDMNVKISNENVDEVVGKWESSAWEE